MAKVTLVWSIVWRPGPGQVEHLVAEPVESRQQSACSSAVYPKGSWAPTPPDVLGEIVRCAKCLRIGGPDGWGAELVKKESE